MRSPTQLLATLTLLTTLTISNFSFIQNPKAKTQNSQVLAQTLDKWEIIADRLLQQGIQQHQVSQFEAALQSWQQALKIYQEIKDRRGESASLSNIGLAYYSLGDYTRAIEYHQQSLAIAREIKNRRGEGASLGNLGVTYQTLGDYAKAIEYHQQSLSIEREIKNRQGEGQSLDNLGIAYEALGDYAKAIEHHQQSLTIAREIKDPLGESQSLDNLGIAYYGLADYAKAIEYHQQSLTIARQILDRLGESQSLRNLGNTYYSSGDYTQAIDYQQQSLAIAREIKDRRGEGQALGGLGVAYYGLGNYPKAIEYHQQSLTIAREIKDRLGEGQSLSNLGLAYDALGDDAKSIEYQQQNLAIAREIKDRRGEGQALGGLGVAYYGLGNYTKAIKYHQESLAIAQEIKNRLGEGASLGNLGLAYDALGDYAKAIEHYQQSLAIAREIKDRQGEGTSLNNLGLALQRSGNLLEAETILRAGIEVWESQRGRVGNNDAYKISIFEEQARTYRTLQKVLIAQNKTNGALEIAEQGRARAFVELLANRNTAIATSPNHSITPPTIGLLQQIAKQQNATLVEYSIIYDDFKINGKEEGKESEIYIWVIKPTGEVTFHKADLKPLWQQQNTSLAELITHSREAIGVRNRGGIAIVPAKLTPAAQQHQLAQQRQKLQQLHQLLIEPIAQELPTDPQARVIFIPQGELFLVPFPALVDATGKYLIEKHTLLTAPSIQALDFTQQQRQQTNSALTDQPNFRNRDTSDVLIVGNPLMPEVWNPKSGKAEQLSSLAGAEREAQAIAKFLNASALLGKQATERTVKQHISNARIIHLATHGLLDYGTPQDTGVRDFPGAMALTPGAGEDGLLTSAEILQMNLQAELVVLSACDTGRGKLTGDGVIGLSRAFMAAGVPSVMVSLWSVPDAPTAELMTEFYRQWQQQPDKAQALRQAMLMTKQTHPNPRDWAAFTLIGEVK